MATIIHPETKLKKMAAISENRRLSVLLVFSRDNPMLRLFKQALSRTNFYSVTALNSTMAVELSAATMFDIIIIDTLTSAALPDARELCRDLRRLCPYSVIVAVRDKTCCRSASSTKPEFKILLNDGFNCDFVECGGVDMCHDFLLCLEKEVNLIIQIPLGEAYFMIVENVQDPVTLTNNAFEIQYVNRGFEKLFGYTFDESIGSDFHQLVCSNKDSIEKNIQETLEHSIQWEGSYPVRTKSQYIIWMKTKVCSLVITSKMVYYVIIMKDMNQPSTRSDISSSTAFDIPTRRLSFARERSKSISIDGTYVSQSALTQMFELLQPLQGTPLPSDAAEVIDKVLLLLADRGQRSIKKTPDAKLEDETVNVLIDGLTTSQPAASEEKRSKRITLVSHAYENRHVSIDQGQPNSLVQENVKQIQFALEKILNWDFSVLNLEKLTSNKPLLYTGLKLFQDFNIHKYLQIDLTVVKSWLEIMEANYHRSNTYHNSSHAADVLQCSAYFCRREKLSFMMDDMDVTCVLISSIIHDLDHPGRTNSFLINSGNKLAHLYNDISPLENHHAALAFRLTTRDNNVNIFQNLSPEDYKQVRLQIIDMVLATDMTRHFEHVGRFNDLMTQRGGSFVNGVDVLNEEMMIIKRMLIKCSDVSNPVRPLETCKVWALRIAEEYFKQTDEEKRKGLPILMPIFDRETCNLPKTQISFLNLFIRNMYGVWSELLSISEVMNCLQENSDYWSNLDAT